MARFATVTDSLTGEPVIVNLDQIHCMRDRVTGGEHTTIIDFGRDFVQCKETMNDLEIYLSLEIWREYERMRGKK